MSNTTYDIQRAVDTLTMRQPIHRNAGSYYQGSHSEVFAHRRWSQMFRLNGTYVMNFCKTVVDTVLDRLEISTVSATTQKAQKAIDEMWEENELMLDATEIHRNALVFGECYAVVWPDEDGDVSITYNSPLTTIMIYDDENPRVKRYAVKMWEEINSIGVKSTRLNLYYADRVEKYRRQGELSVAGGSGAGGWMSPFEVVENPFGEIPVFHFRTHRPYGTPEHESAIGPQDAINKLVNNHMLTVDYQGAPQRYALSAFGNTSELEDFGDDDTIRENIEGLKNGPGELWYLNGVTQVGQFNPAPPETFTKPVESYVQSLASLTNTPLHFFKAGTVYGSGEALRSAEAPLTKKVRDRQLSFGQTWREVFKFALKIEGIDADVQVKWNSPESMDTTDAWNIAAIKKGMGISLVTILTEMGYDTQIAEEIAKDAEASTAAGNMTTAAINPHNLALHAQAEAEKQNQQDNAPADNTQNDTQEKK
jgi:SPP1 family phage portal protein